jgi:small GTP-binding protein
MARFYIFDNYASLKPQPFFIDSLFIVAIHFLSNANRRNSMSMRGKVVIVGDAGVGKTALLFRFKRGSYEDTTPTIGANSIQCQVSLSPDRVVTLNVWDTAGQDDFKSLLPMFVRGAEVAVVVYDVSRHFTFEHVEQWISFFRSDTAICAVVLASNKSDLEHDVDPGEIEEICAHHGLQHFETSAVTGEGVELLFREIAERVNENAMARSGPSLARAGTVEINAKRTANEGKCC